MEIAKNTTKLTKRALSSFQTREIFKKSVSIGICGIILAILGFGVSNGQIYLRSIPFLVIGLCVYPLYVIILKILFAKQNKNFETTTIDYVFTDEKILVNGTTGTSTEKNEVNYFQLLKIRQTKKHIFLYINSSSALVVDKTSFTHGTAEKVVELVKLRLTQKEKTLKPNTKKK